MAERSSLGDVPVPLFSSFCFLMLFMGLVGSSGESIEDLFLTWRVPAKSLETVLPEGDFPELEGTKFFCLDSTS